jgi:DNA-binding GntR family transcriptional regulator
MLRRSIVNGAFAPGTHLRVPEIARQLGVSRTPAREALLLLAREGLVDSREGAGMRVVVGDIESLRLMLEMREVLEGLAARRCAEHMPGASRERLVTVIDEHRAALEANDLEAHVNIDAEFHRLLRDGAASPPLAQELARLERLTILVNRTLSTQEGFSQRVVEKDHRGIADAILSRNGKAAEDAARHHVRRMLRFLEA